MNIKNKILVWISNKIISDILKTIQFTKKWLKINKKYCKIGL